jgi:hypothetical protein
MATTTAAPRIRYIGVTDECVQCQKCGKDDLRATVVLAFLDADGNPEEITWYGSTCAARALKERGITVRGGGPAILNAARWAQEKTARQAQDAREMLAFYGLPEAGDIHPGVLALAAARYAEVHTQHSWSQDKPLAEWAADVRDMVARRRAEIADAALVGA